MATLPVAAAEVPDSIKQLRACLNCKMIKTQTQFDQSGCDNCGEDYSVSAHYRGIVAMMQPTQSWVARRLHLGALIDGGLPALKPGVYAVKVPGEDEAAAAAAAGGDDEGADYYSGSDMEEA